MLWLEQYWYRISWLHLLLWPLSLIFGLISALRRVLYRKNLLSVTRLPVPVVIIGNVNVGGTGKTPCVIWLCQWLVGQGFKPGIVTRGYGGSARLQQQAAIDSNPNVVSDEAVLLARRSGCPVWIGADRVSAARMLLQTHPECNVIVSDDGLQHYALARDVEISVIDGQRGLGNGMLLPAGPLRETVNRLTHVDAMVINGGASFPLDILPCDVPTFDLHMGGTTFYNLCDPKNTADAAYFAEKSVHAAAAIGNPQRFFDHLHELGISFKPHPFPDHHLYAPSDLSFGAKTTVIMTEKDAVKCERFHDENFWALRVDVAVDPALGDLVLRKLRK